MKKNLFLAAAAVAFMASCSNEEAALPQINTIENSNILIALDTKGNLPSISTGNSRAAMTGWNDTEVGIYALSKNEGLLWNSATPAPNYGCIMQNVKSTIAADGTVGLDKTYYYPLNTSYNYSFYGYYPYQANEKLTLTEDKLIVTFPEFDGQTDILYGMAEVDPTAAVDGYNARYIRKGGDAPALKFNHSLASLRFKVKEGVKAGNLTITRITLKNVPDDLSMIVADNSGEQEGTMQAKTFGNAYHLNTNILTTGAEGNPVHEVEGEIFFPVIAGTYKEAQESDTNKRVYLEGSITLKYASDSHAAEDTSEATLDFIIRSPKASEEDANARTSFETGKYYTVTITVNGGEAITLGNASIEHEFENGGDSEAEAN